MQGLSIKKVASDVSRAKAKEAHITYLADRKVARAVEHAMRHSGGHLEKALAKAAVPGLGGVAVAGLAGLESAHLSGMQRQAPASLAGTQAGAHQISLPEIKANDQQQHQLPACHTLTPHPAAARILPSLLHVPALPPAAHDSKHIAHAMAKAARMKARAKKHTVKVVVKSLGEAAASNMAYGTKALGAIGTAALNDASTFAPILNTLAPKFLPQLASVASVGPAALGNVLGDLAQSIGGALLGNSNIGVAGPDLLATRVVSMLPNDLLSTLLDAGSSVGGLSPQSLLDSIPPQVLEAIAGFLANGE